MHSVIKLTVTLTFCSVALSGCFSIPKNRTEFRQAPDIQKLVFTPPRSLDAVVASLNKQSVACEMTGETAANGFKNQSVTIISTMTVKKVSANKAELTYQVGKNNAIGQSDGGNFVYVADFQAKGPRLTEATFYHPAVHQTPLTNTLRKWTEGDVSSCFRATE